MRRTVVTEDARIETGHPVDEVEAELLSAMSLFDKFPLIALQRAVNGDGSRAGYRCSIPLYANDPDKAGQLIATVDGDGATAAQAIYAAAVKAKARLS
jgi:hypothetical protein